MLTTGSVEVKEDMFAIEKKNYHHKKKEAEMRSEITNDRSLPC